MFNKYTDKIIDKSNKYYGLYFDLKKAKLSQPGKNEVEKLRRERADFVTQ